MKNKHTIAVIGAGQLGSRHLQGILKSNLDLEVFVVDLNAESLLVAEQRANEIKHNHHVQYINSIDKLPQVLNLVIVATNADVRAFVTELLISTKQVENLVLEKVLFQKISDYSHIEQLLTKHKVKTWVNHPRRVQTFYQDIKNELNQSSKMSVQVYGQNWGMACNGLHLLDLISFLSGSDISKINTDKLDTEILTSKRAGYIELTGCLTGETDNGTDFSIHSVFAKDDSVKPLTITIATPETRFIIQEGGISQIIKICSNNNYIPEVKEYKMLFQSDLSGDLLNDILTTGECKLPTYLEACKTHLPFISSLLDFYNTATNQNVASCPIT